MGLQEAFRTGSIFEAGDDLLQTGDSYSAGEKHRARAVVRIVLAFVPQLVFANFLRMLFLAPVFALVLAMGSLYVLHRSRLLCDIVSPSVDRFLYPFPCPKQWSIKAGLYRIWCGVHTLGDTSAFVDPVGQLLLTRLTPTNCCLILFHPVSLRVFVSKHSSSSSFSLFGVGASRFQSSR